MFIIFKTSLRILLNRQLYINFDLVTDDISIEVISIFKSINCQEISLTDSAQLINDRFNLLQSLLLV